MTRLFVLSEGAFQRASDYDVVMLYQVMLGRNPENSQVIQDHGANPFNVALQTFIASQEFRESVLNPLSRAEPVLRHDIVPRPSAEQLNWLFSRTLLDDAVKAELREAPGWEAFFQILCGLDGFLEPLPAPPPRPVRPAMPFKPNARILAPEPPPAPPSDQAILARLDRLEAMLADLTALVTQAVQSAAPAQSAAAEARARAAVKPSSRRQAR